MDNSYILCHRLGGRWNASRWIATVGLAASLALSSSTSRAAESRRPAVAALAAPGFSPRGGVYTNRVTLRLTAGEPGEVIRYTVDGSEPTGLSPQYSQPLELDGTTLVKARTFGSQGSSSAAAAQTYIRADSDVAGFSSNLPLVIINSFGRPVGRDPKVPVAVRFIDTQSARSRLTGPADFAGEGDLNVRGYTSLRYPKHSYHLKTRDSSRYPLKASILGLPKDDDWVLYAPYPDKTLMRDVLGYELSNQLGRYAPRTRFVEVFINESGRKLSLRDYVGVYVFLEKISRGKDRVDIAKLGPADNTEPRITGGYIFKKDHQDPVDAEPGLFAALRRSFSGRGLRFRTSRGNEFFYVEPKAGDITAPQRDWLTRHLNDFEHALYGEHFRDPQSGYAAFIEPGSFIDHHLLVEVSKNIDGFRFSTFYSKDRGGRISLGPIWDWNLTFGGAEGREGWRPENWYWPQLDDEQYTWFRRLFEDPDFAQLYVDRWGELRARQFAISNLHALIDQWSELLDEAQARNFRRWPILGQRVHPNSYVGESFSDEVSYLKHWIQQRITWIDRQFLTAPSFSQPPGLADRRSRLLLRVAAGEIYYTLDGSDPRAPGGAVSRSARCYSSPIVLDQTVAVCCRTRLGSKWSYPARAKFAASPPASPVGGHN